MTNFEKWKRESNQRLGLTLEDCFREGHHAGIPYRAVIFMCSGCPAITCPRKTSNFIRDAICEREFLEWANAPAGC